MLCCQYCKPHASIALTSVYQCAKKTSNCVGNNRSAIGQDSTCITSCQYCKPDALIALITVYNIVHENTCDSFENIPSAIGTIVKKILAICSAKGLILRFLFRESYRFLDIHYMIDCIIVKSQALNFLNAKRCLPFPLSQQASEKNVIIILNQKQN